MGKLVINNGGIETNKKMASIDERYGPYDSKETANYELGASGRNVIAAGLTVGIMQPDKSIKEYCYQPNAMGQLELVPKGDIPEIPEDDTDKVLGMDENGNPQWVPRPKDGDDVYTIFKKDYEEKHPGEEAPSKTEWLASLKGDPGQKGADAVSHFKGSYASRDALAIKYPTPSVGDYAYVEKSGDTYICRCSTEGAWPAEIDITEQKEPTNAAFADGEVLSNVHVDKTHLTDYTDDDINNPAVAKVSDVMLLNSKLHKVTMRETKVQIADEDLYPGYVQTYNDAAGLNYIDSVPKVSATSSTRYAIINVAGHKSVRFLGRLVKTSTKAMTGWAFYDETNYDSDNDDFFTDRTGLISYRSYDMNTEDVETVKEYVVDIPDGAVYLKVNVKIQQVRPSNFYCYLQDGPAAASTDSVNELDKKTFGSIVRHVENIDESNIVDGSSNYFNFSFNLNITNAKSNNFSIHRYIKTSYCRKLREEGKKLLISKSGDYSCWVTFLKHEPPQGRVSLQGLIDNDCLSCVHNFNGGYNAVIALYGEHEIEIPEDCLYIYLTNHASANASSPENHLPDSIKVVSYERADDGLEAKVDELTKDYNDTKEDVADVYDEVFGEIEQSVVEGYDYKGTEIVKGMSIDNNKCYTDQSQNEKYRVIAINLEGVEKIVITPRERSVYSVITNQPLPIGRWTSAEMWATYCDQECYDSNNLGGDAQNYRLIIRPEGTEGAQISGTTEVTLTPNSKWIYIQKFYKNGDKDYSPAEIELHRNTRSNGLIELRKKIEGSSNVASGSIIGFLQGYYDENSGTFKKSDSYVTTSLIPMDKGCLLTLFGDNYRIYQAHLFDSNGKMVNPRELYAKNQAWGNCLSYPQLAAARPQFYIRLKIGTPSGDSGIADVGDRIIKEFVWLDNPRLKRKLPTNAEMQAWAEQCEVQLPDNYDIEGAFQKVHSRTNTLLNVLWTPVRQGEAMISAGAGGGSNYAKKGYLMHGVPYSEASEYSKYIGQHVSLRTFLTAMLNPRSVVYTENISRNNVSKYGISYTGVHSVSNGVTSLLSGPYYGTVCTGYTAYAQGRSEIRLSSNLQDELVNLLGKYSSVEFGDVNNPYPQLTGGGDIFDKIMPLDILWYTGHAMLVTDVYTDEFGRNRYIVITEQTIPVLRSTVFTREMFKNRFVKKVTDQQSDTDQWTVYRYKGWTDDIYESAATREYECDNTLVQREFDAYAPLEEATIEDYDIQCFAGDYAAFPIGDPSQESGHDELNNNKMYLNIHRGAGYTHLQIFREEEDDYNNDIVTLPIGTDEDYVEDSADSNILDEDAQNREDWIRFNLADYWYGNKSFGDSLLYGKFKARIVKMDSNGNIVLREDSEDYFVSGFVHFEMVYIGDDTTTKVVRVNNSNYTCHFKTSGIPYLIRQEKKNGLPNKDYYHIHEIQSNEYRDDDGIKSGNIPLNWAYRNDQKYIKVYVRGEYGVVVKRMEMAYVA